MQGTEEVSVTAYDKRIALYSGCRDSKEATTPSEIMDRCLWKQLFISLFF